MTLIVIELHGAVAGALLSDGAPENLRYLAAQGCAGEWTGYALWARLEPHAGRSILVDGAQGSPEALLPAIETDQYDYIHVTLQADTSAALRNLDHDLGLALEALGEDDILVLLAAAPEHASFLIVGRSVPPGLQLGPADDDDLALTLLALAGKPRPAEMSGRLLIAAVAATPEDDDEAALRERFRGLGYIA